MIRRNTIISFVANRVLDTFKWLFSKRARQATRLKIKATNDHGIELRAFTRSRDFKEWDLVHLLDIEPAWLEGMYFYLTASEPPAPPKKKESWAAWGERHGGLDVSFSHVLLILQALEDRTIAVRTPKINVQRWNLNAGRIYGPEGVGGNGLMTRQFYVDLNKADPVPIFIDEHGERDHGATFTMKRGDTWAVIVIAEVSRGRVDWTIDLPLLVDGFEMTLTATQQGGLPFSTVGSEGLETLYWVDDEQRWSSLE